jgi:ubiquinone/menaquinone biosynthesis C-methylase UbiE
MGGEWYSDDDTMAEQYSDATNLNARIALHARHSTADRDLPVWQFDQFDLPADADVLGVGSGPGGLWETNRERVPAGWSVTLTDRSPGMVREAREALGRAFQFGVADAASLPFRADAFDAVAAHHMLYHVPDRDAALADVARVLRPGGRLHATTNGEAHLRELRAVIAAATGEPVAAAGGEFTLENGGKQLAPHFSAVELRRFEDALRVPAVEPLVAYALSRPDVSESDADALRVAFRDRVGEGAFHVTKDVGTFVATV